MLVKAEVHRLVYKAIKISDQFTNSSKTFLLSWEHQVKFFR